MASKYGPRAMGTDGSDFRHRQRVALHYRDSVTNKFRLKITVALHSSLLVLMLLKLLEDILDRFEIDWAILERLRVPVPGLWEYWWMLSALPCLGSLTALSRNNWRRLRRCYYGYFLFALIPVAVGAGSKLPELLDYVGGYGARDGDGEADDTAQRFLGFPMVVVWFMFFAVALQVHVFTMYFISILIKSWQPPVTKSTTTPAATLQQSVSTDKLAGNNGPASWQNDKKVR